MTNGTSEHPEEATDSKEKETKDDDSTKSEGDEDAGIERGMKLDVKSLYREDYDHAWEDWTPDHEKMDAERLKNSRFAVVVRHEMDTAADSGLRLHSITIQSPLLRKILDKLFHGYRDISTKLKELTFSCPFHEFYFRWDRYIELTEQETDDTTRSHIALLNKTIKPEIEPHVELGKELRKEGTITFDYLWILFQQDAEVCAQIAKQNRLFNLVRASYQKTQVGVVFSMTCKFVSFDGDRFGYQNHTFQIKAFEGHRRVSELSVLPLDLHSRRDAIVTQTTARGRTFVKLQGVNYKSYYGFVEPADPRRKRQKIDGGRVVIDAAGYNNENVEDEQHLETLQDASDKFSDTVNNQDLDRDDDYFIFL